LLAASLEETMKNFNLVNVLDKELTCYPGGVFPEGEMQETIEFGLTVVNLRSLEIVKTVSIPIIPVMSKVSPYCTALTGWTMPHLQKQGVTFAEGCRRLSAKNGTQNRLLVTDSNGDVTGLRAQCALMGVTYPFGEDHMNVSTMFTLVTGQTRNLSLEEKLKLLGMAFEGTPHRAGSDSFNIARLLLALVEMGRGAFHDALVP
jgi:inhibitor of KinA sporulation pathway (predicted exonuclease)